MLIGIFTVVGAGTIVLASLFAAERADLPVPRLMGNRLDKLWRLAQFSLKSRKYLNAEKALLTILKLDKRNAAAYNHLGILYSRQREYGDAIECFEIASSIRPSATTFHNLGLVYYETENFEKAAVALESALSVDDQLASRHIAYAKILEKLDRLDKAIEHMRKAVSLEPTRQAFKLLIDLYRASGYNREATVLEKRVHKLEDQAKLNTRVSRPSRVVY